MDDLPSRINLAALCWTEYHVRVDPEKHTYEQLADMKERLRWAKRLKTECNVILPWYQYTVRQMQDIYDEQFLGTD